MAPRFVKAYRKSDKNDRNDAEAICETLTRPNVRFVAVNPPQATSRADGESGV